MSRRHCFYTFICRRLLETSGKASVKRSELQVGTREVTKLASVGGNADGGRISIPAFLIRQEQTITKSEAWKNPVFERAARRPWTRPELELIGPEYYAFTRSFPGILAKLLARVGDEEIRAFLTNILFSELARISHTQFESCTIVFNRIAASW